MSDEDDAQKTAYRAELAELRKAFAKNLKRLRRAKEPGYSQEDLCADTGLHRTAIGNYERAHAEPYISTLLVLADALGVTPNDLLEGLPVPRERRPPPTKKAKPRRAKR